jgi:hypothetical protein
MASSNGFSQLGTQQFGTQAQFNTQAAGMTVDAALNTGLTFDFPSTQDGFLQFTDFSQVLSRHRRGARGPRAQPAPARSMD